MVDIYSNERREAASSTEREQIREKSKSQTGGWNVALELEEVWMRKSMKLWKEDMDIIAGHDIVEVVCNVWVTYRDNCRDHRSSHYRCLSSSSSSSSLSQTFTDVLLLKSLKGAGAAQSFDIRQIVKRTSTVSRHDCSKTTNSLKTSKILTMESGMFGRTKKKKNRKKKV